VLLERGVCSCAELQAFSCYRGGSMPADARDFNNMKTRAVIKFFLQGEAPKEGHATVTETLGEHAPSYATVKHWEAQFKRGDFSTCDAPCSG